MVFHHPAKVTFIITGLNIGGAEMMLLKLLSEINRIHFAPVVVSLRERGALSERIEALGVPVYVIGIKHRRISFTGFWRLLRLLRKLNPDIIQGWMVHGNLVFCDSRDFK